MNDGVYIVQDGRGRVKIGYSTDIATRLKSLQSATGDEINLLRIITGTKITERWLHRRFSKQRIRGEWFWFSSDMLAVVTPDELPPRQTIHLRGKPTPERFLEAAEFLGLMDDAKHREWALAMSRMP